MRAIWKGAISFGLVNHLAAIKPQEKGLMLELMHFADELRDVEEFKLPAEQKAGKKELQMAAALIDSMSAEWKPEEYVDEYRVTLEKVIEEKIEKGDKALPKTVRRRPPSNVIDLVSVLQKSLAETGANRKRKPSCGGTRRKSAA